MLLAPGESVPGHKANYVVERVVGTGAFAAVYYARDPALPDRHVALKEFFSPRHPREQATLRALFDRERYVGAQASPHPLMPTFYEAFSYDGRFYIAQEFIAGTTLDDIIFKRHPLPREWVLKWAVSLCDALAFLHSRQIVHHDLKPANIRISPQGHLTLLDFGAAQYFGEGYEDQDAVEMYGTEGYLPPELEADGRWVADVRTDIFALGCILYEMIAGVAPNQENINARSMYVTNSLIQQPNADLNLVRLINIAVSYNTDYRFGSANDFLLELRKIAPPVLLVSKKHLRFGPVSAGSPPQPLTVTLYNAGGGELRGEVKPRAPWIMVSAATFRGNMREVAVQPDLTKISERGELVTGRLEINSPDQRDAEGNIISSGDRWFIECSVTVQLQPGLLQATERPTPDAPPVVVAGRKGQPAVGAFHLRNVGEQPVEFRVGHGAGAITEGVANPVEGLAVSPTGGSLAPGQSVTVRVEVPTGDLATGSYPTAVTVRTDANQTLSVPLDLRVQSPFDFLRSMLGRRAAS